MRTITEQKIVEFRRRLVLDEKEESTIKKYMRDVRAFHRYVGMRAVTKERVIEYKNKLIDSHAPASVNSMLAAINRFFKEQGWYDCTVRAVKIQNKSFRDRERELTKEDYYSLLQTARNRGNQRLCLLMQTICSTGIRVSEHSFITVEAVRRGRATVSLKGKTRQVLLPRTLVVELTRYISENGIKNGSVFVSKNGKPLDRSNILHEMKALCAEAGVEKTKVFPHNLRHLFACQYYSMEKDISSLADILGHSNINTTRIYTSTSGVEQQQKIDRLGLTTAYPSIPCLPQIINYAVPFRRVFV